MIRYFILIIGVLSTISLSAQIPQYRNSVRLGIDLTSLDAPDAVGPRLVARLARHFGNDRLTLAAEAGYMVKTTANVLFNDIDPGPDRRERFTTDATLFFDLLPSPRHALRLGVGGSAWYRRDDIYRGAALISTAAGAQGVAIDRQKRHELNTGGHVAVEYGWSFGSRWSADIRFRLADLSKAGISSMAGVGVSHYF